MKKTKFKPKQGQIDYTNARWAPVMNCVVKYRDKILIVRRSKELNFYPGYWNGISGFLDDKRSFAQKVKDELQEELGISSRMIKKIRLCEIFHQEAPQYKKTWIVHPVLVEVNTDKVKFNWEASNYRWVRLNNARKLKLLPGFDKVLEKVSPWITPK
ncbi:MAG: NUDIX domain-containing protein [Candidatus Niyogibacteria bacterium]|nr:NUDIX domain-containing protein [Candidatus Niyogibacteria bacterium]